MSPGSSKSYCPRCPSRLDVMEICPLLCLSSRCSWACSSGSCACVPAVDIAALACSSLSAVGDALPFIPAWSPMPALTCARHWCRYPADTTHVVRGLLELPARRLMKPSASRLLRIARLRLFRLLQALVAACLGLMPRRQWAPLNKFCACQSTSQPNQWSHPCPFQADPGAASAPDSQPLCCEALVQGLAVSLSALLISRRAVSDSCASSSTSRHVHSPSPTNRSRHAGSTSPCPWWSAAVVCFACETVRLSASSHELWRGRSPLFNVSLVSLGPTRGAWLVKPSSPQAPSPHPRRSSSSPRGCPRTITEQILGDVRGTALQHLSDDLIR